MSGDQWYSLGVSLMVIVAGVSGMIAVRWQPDRKGKAYAQALTHVASVMPKDGDNPWFQLVDFDLCNSPQGMYIWCRKCDVKAVPMVITGDSMSSLVTVCLEHTHVVTD